jgi:hypothetical protein
MVSAIAQCGIRTILTFKLFLAKAKLEPVDGMIYLEDILRQFSSTQKLFTAAAAFLLPTRWIESFANREKRGTDSLATVIFRAAARECRKG